MGYPIACLDVICEVWRETIRQLRNGRVRRRVHVRAQGMYACNIYVQCTYACNICMDAMYVCMQYIHAMYVSNVCMQYIHAVYVSNVGMYAM